MCLFIFNNIYFLGYIITTPYIDLYLNKNFNKKFDISCMGMCA